MTVIIVGAGPSGLAMAYHMQKRGIPYRVLEKANVGEAWRHHYDSLALHTLKPVSHLPGLSMPDTYPDFPRKNEFLQYLEGYARHFDLNIETGVTVQCAGRVDGGWRLETTRGAMEAAVLVAATGIWQTPHRPEFPGEAAFTGRIIHARDYRNAEPFAGQRVLVVGGGNSGTEMAVEVAQVAAETGINIRGGSTFVPYPGSALAVSFLAWAFRTMPERWGEAFLQRVRRDFRHLGIPSPRLPLTKAYPVVGYELPEAVAAGRVKVFADIERFEADGVRLVDGQFKPLDAVILATGYRPTTHFIAPYLEFDARGWPKLDHWRSTLEPSLFCVGFWYPATEGFLQSLPRVSAQAADSIAKMLAMPG